MLQESADIVEERPRSERAVGSKRADHYSVARNSILRARKRMTRALLEIVRATEKLQESTGIDSKRTQIWLMEECGLTKADTRTVRHFPARLRMHEQVIKTRRVAPETIRALVATSDDVRADAIARISGGEVLSPYKVQAIRRAKLAEITSDSHDWHLECQRHLRKSANQEGGRLLADIQNAARELLDERAASAVRHAVIETMDEDEFRYYVETPEYERDAKTLVRLVRTLREKFQVLFPGPHPTRAEAFTIALTDHYAAWIANCHHDLYQLMYDCRPGTRVGEAMLKQLAGLKNARPVESNVSSQPRVAAAEVTPVLPGRLSLRAVKTLKSVELCAGAGGEAIGLCAAGFRPSLLVDNDMHAAITLKTNRSDWKVLRNRLDASKVAKELDHLKGTVDLVAGGVPCQPFSTGGKSKGENDERNQFPQAIDIVKTVRPKAFYFENVEGLRDDTHASYLLEILSRLQQLDYSIGTYIVDAADWGLPQRRRRMIIYGLSRDLGVKELMAPKPSLDLSTNLLNGVADVLFPYWSKSKTPQGDKFPAKDQEVYDRWVEAWLAEHGKKIAPTVTGVNPSPAVQGNWQKAGFDYERLMPEPVKPSEVSRDDMLAPITIQLLMRLQGFPDGWQLSPTASLAVQRRLVANAFPPVLARVIGQQLHGLISGEPIDLTAAAMDPIKIDALKPATRKAFNRIRYPDDPQREAAFRIREELENEEGPDDHLGLETDPS